MADPVLVVCALGSWTKIATNVTTGIVHRKDSDAKYFQTYRMTGNPAPSDLTDAVQIFTKEDSAEISNSAAIDVYIYCQVDAGLVRVDL